MSEVRHSRPSQPVPPATQCPVRPESDLIAAQQRRTLRNRSARYCGARKDGRGPRDRTYRGYLVRENPWLQLQGPPQCPLCPHSDEVPQHAETTRWAIYRHIRYDNFSIDYSRTSSARASSGGGMFKPRALAVFRLTMKSILATFSIGRSSGRAPRRILATSAATCWKATCKRAP
jgi:hypothetical protein